MEDDALKIVRSALPRLSAREADVAAHVLADPQIVLDSTVAELSHAAGTSTATVARFCQSVGFAGYREFRVAIAATVSRSQAELVRFELDDSEIAPDDGIEEVIAKVRFQDVLAIEQTLGDVDREAVKKVIDALVAARRIEITGFGASGLTAADLNEKLRRIGYPSGYNADVHFALPSSANLGPGDALVAFSHSGRTSDTIGVLSAAAEAGAVTVAVTNAPDSSLATLADITIVTRARESKFRSGAMASRSAQHAVVDVIFIATAQHDMERTTRALRRTYDSVSGHRLPS